MRRRGYHRQRHWHSCGRRLRDRPCASAGNGGQGIFAGGAASISNCSVSENTGSTGIAAGQGAAILGCTADLNGGSGINAQLAGTISKCTVRRNGVGITTGAGTSVLECTAHDNNGAGLFVLGDSTISNCTVSENDGDGIQVGSNSRVVGNHCVENGFQAADGAGILVTGGRGHIEGNTCLNNDRGIEITVSDGLVIRNTVNGNTTNYNFNASIARGELLDFSAGGTITEATGPWANVEY
jgi:parallel beta-helix repeat protein